MAVTRRIGNLVTLGLAVPSPSLLACPRTGGGSSRLDRFAVLQLPAECLQRVAEPRSCRAVRYPELAGDLRERVPLVEGLNQDRAVRG